MENNIEDIFDNYEEIKNIKITYEDEILSKYLVTRLYLDENKLTESEDLLTTIIDKLEKENI